MLENRDDYINIHDKYPEWYDVVKVLFRVENERLFRNELPICYFRREVDFIEWNSKINKEINAHRVIACYKWFKSADVMFYLHYGYKAKRLYVLNEKQLPILSDVKDFYKRDRVELGSRYDNKDLGLL